METKIEAAIYDTKQSIDKEYENILLATTRRDLLITRLHSLEKIDKDKSLK